MPRTKAFDPEVALGAAIDLFWRRGYADTSVQDLVETLGLNRGSLYGTFGQKHDLFLAALARYCEDAPAPILEALERPGPLVPRLRDMLITLVDQDLQEPRRGCFLINSAMELPADPGTIELFAATTTGIRLALESAIRSAQTLGELGTEVHPAQAAAFLLTTLQGLRVLAKAGGDRRSLISSIDLAVSILN